MTTPRTRRIVSLAATISAALAPGACARGPARGPAAAPAVTYRAPVTIRFENEGRERVHVYLVGEEREWLLGRVEPGARAALRVPDASLAGSSGYVRLAVLPGEGLTLRAARDPRARLTVAQPAQTIGAERWAFTLGQLTPQRSVGAAAAAGRP